MTQAEQLIAQHRLRLTDEDGSIVDLVVTSRHGAQVTLAALVNGRSVATETVDEGKLARLIKSYSTRKSVTQPKSEESEEKENPKRRFFKKKTDD